MTSKQTYTYQPNIANKQEDDTTKHADTENYQENKHPHMADIETYQVKNKNYRQKFRKT
ncbi:hypothetical protein ACQ1Q5_02190 [Ornithobacterium rhinotracheale]